MGNKKQLPRNVEILNALEEKIFEQNIFDVSKAAVNILNATSGIYFVKVYNGENYYCEKIIINHY